MDMTITRTARTALLVAIIAALGLVAGCNKPTKESCRQAIENMRTLMGTDHLDTDVEGEVRRCNGGSTKPAVDCAIKATTLDELRNCKFMHLPAPTPTGSAAGSAMGSVGSAGSAGSAAK